MAACFIFCLTTVLTGVIVADTSVTGNATVIIVSKKGNWSEAKQDCHEIYNGELVPAVNVTCSLSQTRYNQSIWSGGYKVPSWVKSEGCYKLEGNLTRLVNPPNLSLENCISKCKTRHVGFKKEAGKCMCFESINGLTKMQSTSLCINQCTGSSCIFISMYTVTNVSVDIDFKNESCIGLYLNCKERYPAILPANCSSLHGTMCDNGELMTTNGLYNQSQAVSSCDINNDVLMTDFNKTCAALNGRTAWISIKLIWIDPVFPDKGRYEQHNINYCTYIYCANNGRTGIPLSGNCSRITDGYACKIMDPSTGQMKTTKQVGSIEMTETVTSGNTNEVQKPTLSQRESTVDTSVFTNYTTQQTGTVRVTKLSTTTFVTKNATPMSNPNSNTMELKSTQITTEQRVHVTDNKTEKIDEQESSDLDKVGLIAGVSVATVCITVIILGCLLWRCKLSRKNKKEDNEMYAIPDIVSNNTELEHQYSVLKNTSSENDEKNAYVNYSADINHYNN